MILIQIIVLQCLCACAYAFLNIRVAASVGLLLTLGTDLPPHSLTASYGLAHILAALTVTNLELKTKGNKSYLIC